MAKCSGQKLVTRWHSLEVRIIEGSSYGKRCDTKSLRWCNTFPTESFIMIILLTNCRAFFFIKNPPSPYYISGNLIWIHSLQNEAYILNQGYRAVCNEILRFFFTRAPVANMQRTKPQQWSRPSTLFIEVPLLVEHCFSSQIINELKPLNLMLLAMFLQGPYVSPLQKKALVLFPHKDTRWSELFTQQ